MRKKIAFLLLAFAVSAASLVAQTRTVRTTLDIYVVDVEGGNSVLFVAPSGESVLIDTGNVAPGAVRDAERIMAALTRSGVLRTCPADATIQFGKRSDTIAQSKCRLVLYERYFRDYASRKPVYIGSIWPHL